VLAGVFLFGWLLERRHGGWATLLVFLLAGAGGMFAAIAAGDADLALGANGAALGLLAAWSVRDLLGRRHGIEDDSDMLGVLAIAVVLVLLPLAAPEASAVAGLVGGVIGLVLGLALARLPER
jgi:membrane associated rhomboid family serine protease